MAEAEAIEADEEEVDRRIQEFLDDVQREGRREELGLPEKASDMSEEAREVVRRRLIRERTLERLVAIARGQVEDKETSGEEAQGQEGAEPPQGHDEGSRDQEGDERDADSA